jgi:hypothetical protein
VDLEHDMTITPGEMNAVEDAAVYARALKIIKGEIGAPRVKRAIEWAQEQIEKEKAH